MSLSSAVDFAPIADALRSEIVASYARRGELLEGQSGVATLETNSGFVARRATPLLLMLGYESRTDALDGLRVVDLGCGFGALSLFFAAHGADVTGLDPNAERFQVGASVARKLQLPVRFVRGRVESMALPDATFDLAVLNNSLCYVVERDDRRCALVAVCRMLRPGGRMIARNPNRWNARDQFTGLPLLQLLPPGSASAVARKLGRPRSSVRITSPVTAATELRTAGLAEVRQHGFPGSPRPNALKYVARYHHYTATRPPNGCGAGDGAVSKLGRRTNGLV